MTGEPYTLLAPHYDLLMQDIDYAGWVDHVLELVKRHRLRVRTILDLACGTGTCALLWDARGFEVKGLDGSLDMLREARRKARERGRAVSFAPGRMEAFSLPCAVDLVTCLYDSLNYLLSEGTLKDAFRCVRRSLNPGGAFIFDMNTEYGLSTYWGDRLVVKDNPGLTSIWRNHYDSRRRIASLRLTLFVPRGSLYARIDEEHRERGYTPREVDSLLAESGFSQRFLYRHRTFDAPDAQTGRVMVVALPGAREASAARRRFWGKSLRSRSRCAAGAAAFRPEGREPSRVERSVRRNEGFGEVRR